MESLHGYVRLWVIVVGASTAFWPDVVIGIEGIVINEFQVQGPSQYVELYDGGVGSTLLDGLALVLYSGASEAVYSQPLVLDSIQTSQTGYCLISFGPPLPSADVNSSTVLLSAGLNAIALYDQSGGRIIQAGSAVTDVDLVDAVVYGNSTNPQDSRLVSVLSQGQYPLQKSGPSIGNQDTSLGRCRGWRQVMHSSFRTGNLTPGSDNDCVLPSLVLNELNPTTSESGAQFIEIFDGGLGFQTTDGIMLVAYAGNRLGDSVHVSVDLTGYVTDENGFLVVTANDTNFGDVTSPTLNRPKVFIPRKATGIALHLGAPKRFAQGKPITDYHLIDAIVYQLDGGTVDHALLDVLTPGQDTVVDQDSTDDQDYSISRCYCCSTRNVSAFGRAPISPGAINRMCSIGNRTILETPPNAVRINEVHIGTSGSTDGDFVEIYDEGYGLTALAGKVLVVFIGTEEGGRSHRIVDLLRSATNSEGYLVIAPSSVSPASDFGNLNADWLRDGLDMQQVAGAVALYKRPVAGFTPGSGPTMDGLLDAVVFGNKSTLTLGLLDRLLPGQAIAQNFLPDTGSSILRCYSLHPLDQAAFAAGSPSPVAANTCPPPPCYLNELNSLSSSSSGVFVEFACAGLPYFPLDTVIAVMWNSDVIIAGPLARRRTNKDGFASSNFNRIGRVPNAFALALYYSPHAIDLLDENKEVRLTSTGLLDAVVVEKEGNQEDLTDWLSVLTPGKPPVREDEAFSHRDESLSRCMVDGDWTFVLAHVSRDSRNHCPTRDNPDVLINEINLPEREQFIELFDLGSGFTLLDDFLVVLYSAAGNALQVISLAGYTTDARGYFVLGVQDAHNIGGVYYEFAEGFIDPNSGGVALYRTEGGSFTLLVGDMVTTQGLVDAVIYTNDQGNLGPALYTLMSDDTSLGLDSGDLHFSRCLSGEYRSSSAFSGDRPPTVAAMNDCPVYPSRDVIINELNFGEPSSTPEAYAELYDGGRGNTPLTYLTLVAFAAIDNNGAYQTVDLSGYQTNEQGYFLVGSHDSADLVVTLERTYGTRFEPHGAGAIALYRSHPGVFYHAAPATKRSLLDAVVYTLDTEEETTLVDDLLPSGSFIIFEDESLAEEDGTDESISRCFDANRLSQSAFKLTTPTPKGPNSCGPEEPTPAGIFVSEVNVKSPPGRGFVELFDGGQGSTSLDGYLLIFYQAPRDRSFYEVDLTGKRSGSSGYLVIGGSGVTPTPDVIADDLSFPDGPGAVAVYRGTIDLFPLGTVATSRSLVDVVVYGDPQDRADGLIAKLVPGQIQAYENSELVNGEDVSLSRCISQSPLNVAAFVSTLKTPGSPNNCDALYKPVYINEISPHGAPSERFIELYNDGAGYSSLDAIVLLLLEEGFNIPYSVIPLTGNRTDSNGYYLIENVTELRPIGQVALYRGDYATFNTGRAPIGSMVDQQTYSTHGVDIALLEGSSTVSKETFSRCNRCQSSLGSYLPLAPASPGYKNLCPISAFGTQVTVTLTDASYDAWNSDSTLKPALERVLAKGINSQCRCGFTVDYFCDPKLLEGSVVYQANMYATGPGQSKLLNKSFRAFLMETDKITVDGKAYTVAKPASGTPVYVVVLPVLFAVIVIIALIIAAGYFVKKRKSASRFDDDVKLEERNHNVEFDNPSYTNDGK
ncbi:uncharacterized protein LOC119743169 isoform X1 [Patiria miniata]|uniref:LTD domain-containing protein n=1 Tax=Patiria miniata TaxID=46514 RepID=A0A914BHX5_PATMI|nr:uncharacterized protein LOC119743169 isoform X1 [Patiria miniata]XP_038075466.1 uncharacterized protein LOC119743169 isoform X1 [Patiria miniata]